MISANCSSVLVYAKSITFLLCQYLITWCLTSMCFVRLFVTKLVAMVMQAWLSSRKRTGSSIWMPNSLRKERSQITALHAGARTTKNTRHPGGDYEYVTPSGYFIYYHDLVQNVGCASQSRVGRSYSCHNLTGWAEAR